MMHGPTDKNLRFLAMKRDEDRVSTICQKMECMTAFALMHLQTKKLGK